jgi:chromosome segregation ATPase
MTEGTLESAPKVDQLWQPIQETLADFRSECSGLESLIQGLFDDLDHLRVELERKAMELESEKRLNAEHEGLLRQQREDAEQMGQRLQTQDERLSSTLSTLNEMRDLFLREREEAAQRTKSSEQQAQAHVEQMEKETCELRRQLEQSTTTLQTMTGVTLELAQVREQFSQSQAEIMSLREQLRAAADSSADAHAMRKLEQERNELRDEVELLRDRAVELSQTLVDQKVEMDRQREELTNELKHLRKFVEVQTEMMMNRSPSGAPAAKPADAVTSAVMAQFSKVQRDAAERRRARAPS